MWHWLAGSLPAEGQSVTGSIDWERRYALMRTHTALHVLCGVVFRDYGALVTGGNMEPLAGRMDFEFATMHGDLVSEIEARCNQEIAADRPLRVRILPREEAFQIPDLIRTKINCSRRASGRCARSRSWGWTCRPMAARTWPTPARSVRYGSRTTSPKGAINKRIYIEVEVRRGYDVNISRRSAPGKLPGDGNRGARVLGRGGRLPQARCSRPRVARVYVFYEGPPTANGRPGIHHVLARVFKDIFPRYKTMRGYYVERKGGWDTHGLPVELEIEKQLGFSGKKAIEDYGIAAFNQKCRESVFRYVDEWERLTKRMAYWVDLPTAYFTLTNDYIESLWWILKQYWDRGLIYQGYKVVPYCPRCGTPLSSHELAQGYQEGTKDPSVYVKLPGAGPARHLLPGLDHHALDAAGQRRRGRRQGHRLRAGPARRRQAVAGRGAVGHGVRERERTRCRCCGVSKGGSCWACTTSRSTPSCPSRRTTAT